MVYTTFEINICFIKRVMLYPILPVRTIFEQSPSPSWFNDLTTYLKKNPCIFHPTISSINHWYKMYFVDNLKFTKWGKPHRCEVNETAKHVSYHGVNFDDAMITEQFGCVSNVYTITYWNYAFQDHYFTTSKHP